MTEKAYKYLVEIIYAAVSVKPDANGNDVRVPEVSATHFEFSDDNKERARYEAQKFMDRTMRHGLDLHGGSVIKSVIMPHAIYQVGLIDYNKYEEETKLGIESIRSTLPAQVPETAEPAVIDSNITTQPSI